MRTCAARLALLLTVAAVLTGFLGMHVLNGPHAGHTAVAMDAMADAASLDQPHATDAHGCDCSAPCPVASKMYPPCVPMPSTLTLDAPGASPLVLPAALPAMRIGATGGVLADPRSPSLHELCISRC
ncbi:DUF6153 family protein [Arthrobacter silvisoli]|uniref:DUF6153 family protein n=1 Tax=Arthrobacter silvisoli TaxID=2291022 RepID=UPI00109B8D15|nr:DUF6153 family protein [Arthrobacter silvisoli]